jgi:hypothetical protein
MVKSSHLTINLKDIASLYGQYTSELSRAQNPLWGQDSQGTPAGLPKTKRQQYIGGRQKAKV